MTAAQRPALLDAHAVALVLLLAAAACTAGSAAGFQVPPPAANTTTGASAAGDPRGAGPGLLPGRWFNHIVFVIFENTGYTKAANNKLFAKYAAKGRALRNYYAVKHPSTPNYIALVGGDDFGIKDNKDTGIPYTSVFNLMDAAGVSYKGYQEGYRGRFNCNPKKVPVQKPRWHNPFLNFDYVRNDPTRCARFGSIREFSTDLQARTLPQWSFITPNRVHSGHDTTVAIASKFLDTLLESRLASAIFPAKSLIAIVFDEDDDDEGNHVLAILLDPNGDVLSQGDDHTRYDHYSLLRMVEDNWNLGTLDRQDKTAALISLP